MLLPVNYNKNYFVKMAKNHGPQRLYLQRLKIWNKYNLILIFYKWYLYKLIKIEKVSLYGRFKITSRVYTC